jgi:hypothetical protein
MKGETRKRPLNVSFRRGSSAERVYRDRAGLPETEVIAPGLHPTPSHDLHFHGGWTIADLHFKNFYVGADAWPHADVTKIDHGLAAAMADSHLNNVMEQYFPGSITSTFDGSEKLSGPAPATVSQTDIEALVTSLANQGKLGGDLTSTVFNFMLPPGTVLNDDNTSSGESSSDADRKESKKKSPIPDDEAADSLHGLGGYHGSIHLGSKTIYYAVGVYSEIKADGTENGIPVFDQPWKNVVGTFYHELNEARTDPDVEDAIHAGDDPSAIKFLGWTSKQGEECGDYPVFEAAKLTMVFQEVKLASGTGKVPVQFQYSNHVHGPEGPVSKPDPKAHARIHARVAEPVGD